MEATAALNQRARPFCAKYSTKIKWMVPAPGNHLAFTGDSIRGTEQKNKQRGNGKC